MNNGNDLGIFTSDLSMSEAHDALRCLIECYTYWVVRWPHATDDLVRAGLVKRYGADVEIARGREQHVYYILAIFDARRDGDETLALAYTVIMQDFTQLDVVGKFNDALKNSRWPDLAFDDHLTNVESLRESAHTYAVRAAKFAVLNKK